MISFATALSSLTPNAAWSLTEDDYDNIAWYSPEIEKSSREAILVEQARLQAAQNATEYQRKRAAEYPDYRDYLDGLVKGDQAQMQAYIDACLAVKAKYPKP